MAVIAPPALVEAPPVLPLAFGLLSAVDFRPGRFETGVEWEPNGGTGPLDGIGAPDDTSTLGLPKTLGSDTSADTFDASPFTIYADWQGTPVSFTPEQAQAKAQARLTQWESHRVEQALFSGDLGNTPNLTGVGGSVAPTVVTELKATFAGGIGALEDFIATTLGRSGVIHMTRGMALMGIEDKVLEVKSGRLVTMLGTPVIAGSGYAGTAPDGNGSVETTWAYATAPIIGYRSEVFTSSDRAGDLMDRSTNDLTAIAERTYLIGFDQDAIGAVEVSL